jgi:imidazolonepropionase-like amidohydrolase
MRVFKSLKGISLFLIVLLFIVSFGGEGKEKKKNYLVLTNVRLIDGTGSVPQKNMVIIITNDKFHKIGSKKEISIPKNAKVIDVKGKTVIPGLIDAHVHFTYPPKEEEFFLYNDSIASFRAVHFLNQYLLIGVTTVRDVCSYNNVGIIAKKAFRERLFIGSRPVVVGQGITCTGGHGTEGSRTGIVVEVDGPANFRKAVREQLRRGADLIKILPPYSREEIKAAIEEIHAWERFVTVHSGVFKKQYDFVRWAVEFGADCIEHAYAIPNDVIKLMAEKGIYCVPTLSVLLKLGEETKKKGPEWEWKVKKYFECIEIFKKLKKAGVKMGIGTDYIGKYMSAYPRVYFDEIEKFVEFGYTPMEAIVAATKINAEICNASDKLGTIEKGKLADLLVIDEDPLKDIRNLRKVKVIIQEGKVIKNAL